MPVIDHANKLSENEIRDGIAAIQQTASAGTDIDVLKERLNLLFAGYRQHTAILSVDEVYYRGVRWDERPSHAAQLTYPPDKAVSRCGRANRVGQSIFYASMARNAVFFECRARPDDYIAVSRWRLKNRMFANSVGFTKEVFSGRQSNRDGSLPWEQGSDLHAAPANQLVHGFFAEAFARDVAAEAEHEYTLSIALAEKLLGPIEGGLTVGISDTRVGALIYPALAMRANADNVAFLPDFVDRNLALESVEYIHVDEAIDEMNYRVSVRDFANSFAADGSIDWKSSHSRLQLEAGTRVVAGVEDGRWVIRDMSGNLLEAL